MTIFERLELIRAGYKRHEIDAMIRADEEAAKAPPKEEQPKEEPKPQEPPKEEPKQEENEVDKLKKELDDLRKAMQIQNIQKIGLDTAPEKPVETVLAEAVFGNPTK